MLLSGYVFPPLALYLMWRYRTWPIAAKLALTVAGLSLAAISRYISSAYIMPRLF
jgi:hypothetical protein